MNIHMDHEDIKYVNEDLLHTTSDFHCVSVLVAMGYEIEHVDKTNPSRCIFSFKSTDDLEKTVNLFWLRKLHLNPHAIFEAQRHVKSLMYENE